MKERMKRLFIINSKVIIIELLVIIFSLIYLILFNGFGTPISYVLYALMTYSLICIIVKLYNFIKKLIDKLIDSNQYLRKYRDDIRLRHRLALFASTGINVIYALFKFISGIIFKSIWFISFSLYYLLLVIMRVNLVRTEVNENKTLKEQYIKYRNTGIILLFMNVILSMIILIIVNEKIMITYPSSIAIGISAYTFYILTSSIINLIKYRKLKSPLMSASKVINVVTSLISLLSMEVVLLSVYGGNSTIEFKETMIMATGGGIAIIIIGISMYMIFKATEWIKEN